MKIAAIPTSLALLFLSALAKKEGKKRKTKIRCLALVPVGEEGGLALAGGEQQLLPGVEQHQVGRQQRR